MFLQGREYLFTCFPSSRRFLMFSINLPSSTGYLAFLVHPKAKIFFFSFFSTCSSWALALSHLLRLDLNPLDKLKSLIKTCIVLWFSSGCRLSYLNKYVLKRVLKYVITYLLNQSNFSYGEYLLLTPLPLLLSIFFLIVFLGLIPKGFLVLGTASTGRPWLAMEINIF